MAAMSLPFHCLPISIRMHGRQIVSYAYFLEKVVGRSEMWMLKRRGARTVPCGAPFLRGRNLLPTIYMIMWTMCLSGSNRISLQVRPLCHTVS